MTTRRRRVAPQPRPAKKYTPEELAALKVRLDRVRIELPQAFDRFNAALTRAEEAFVQRLGTSVSGRILLLQRDRWRQFLAFVGGQLVIEEGRIGKPLRTTRLVHACKEARLAAVDRLKDLFIAAGGVV